MRGLDAVGVSVAVASSVVDRSRFQILVSVATGDVRRLSSSLAARQREIKEEEELDANAHLCSTVL
jgi:hypothetical protein